MKICEFAGAFQARPGTYALLRSVRRASSTRFSPPTANVFGRHWHAQQLQVHKKPAFVIYQMFKISQQEGGQRFRSGEDGWQHTAQIVIKGMLNGSSASELKIAYPQPNGSDNSFPPHAKTSAYVYCYVL